MTKTLTMLAALLCAATVSAQPLDTGSITAGGADCSVAARCASFALPNQTVSITLTVSGTYSGTLQFEASADGGTTWFSWSAMAGSTGNPTTSTTSTGTFAIPNVGLTHVRVRASSLVSGTATITAVRGYASVRALPFSSANPVPATSGGTGQSSYAVGDLLYADTTTSLAKLADVATGQVLVSGGTSTAPAYSATPTVTSVTYGTGGTLASGGASGKLTLTGTTPMLQLGGTTSSFPAIKQNGAALSFRLADDSTDAAINSGSVNASGFLTSVSGGLRLGINVLAISTTAPSNISACGAGTAPTFVWTNGTAAFEILTGSATPVATCTWTMPAAAHAWVCDVTDITTQSANVFHQKMTASSTTSVTVTNYNTAGAATAVVASDHLLVKCLGG